MGIKSLNALITNFTINGEKKVHLSKMKGMTLAVDTNLYLYKYLYGKKNHINGIFFMINKLKKFNITPIFVFDGKPPEEKMNKILERRFAKGKLQKRLEILKTELLNVSLDSDKKEIEEKIQNIEKRILYVDREVIDKTIQLFNLMGIAYIQADCEAEQYCSKLSRLGLVQGVISEDTDTIACGSKLVIREFSNKDDNVICYNLDEILYELDINYKSFIHLCILLGNDYNTRVKGYTVEQLYNLIKSHRTIDNLISKNILTLNFDYQSIYSIINLDTIKPDIIKLASQLKKKYNIKELEFFLKNNSTIEEKTFKHRINLMYNKVIENKIHEYKNKKSNFISTSMYKPYKNIIEKVNSTNSNNCSYSIPLNG